MAVFDSRSQRVVVRIVYDGPANAGKTTNLAQLCRLFTPVKRGELRGFGDVAGRTLFFDWLEFDGGLVNGFPLRSQLVTVPGQAVLSHRRRHLLRKADCVVFVCESTRAGTEVARRMMDGLRRDDVEGLPLVVQANKQDLEDRLEPEEVRAALGLSESVQVVTAQANGGIGIRETLAAAIRAAANRAQEAFLAGLLPSLEGDVETAEGLYAALRQEGSAAADEFALGERHAPARPIGSSASPPAALEPPPLPDAAVPPGHIWPVVEGRQRLAEIARYEATRREELVSRAPSDGDDDGAEVVQAGPWVLRTSPRNRSEDVDRGRAVLLAHARARVQMGRLTAVGTTLCLQPDHRGGAWLWTITPRLTTLGAWMRRAEAEGDEEVLQVAMAAFASAIVAALGLATRSELALRLDPGSFALADGRLVYVDDRVTVGGALSDVGYALVRCVDDHATRPNAIVAYVHRLSEELAARLEADEIRRLGLADALGAARARTAPGEDARRHLLHLLGGKS